MARKAFAHDAVVAMRDGSSVDALGGAITKALCGGWDHQPPCPLAPHHVCSSPAGDLVAVRVVFATEPTHEQRVRTLIGDALATGHLEVPDGGIAHWELRSSTAGSLRADEHDLAAHLVEH